MSVALLGSGHVNLIASALIHLAGFPADAGPELSRVLLTENTDAYLRRYFDGPAVLEDPSDYDDEDLEEIEEIRDILRDHHFVAVPAAELKPEAIDDAVGMWRYQVSSQDGHENLAGWKLCDQLEATLAK
ncbi:hypothetical protein [Sanguibacter massiliensis]|uniref:hypothetical protein n=1 Tax=Sanguibacter massiliensis TaxID=1973217 RepID=UPI000C822621|nr:hypothetical protein [Sanguibacter massiliensis]